MKHAGEDRSDANVAVLAAAIEALEPSEATCVLYQLILGRKPDPKGLEYCSQKVGGGPKSRRAAILELLRSEEAQKYGLFETPLDTVRDGKPGPVLGIAEMLIVIASVHRKANLTLERLERIEQLAQLTLLSVPEWCGEAYDRLERRVDELDCRSRFVSQPR